MRHNSSCFGRMFNSCTSWVNIAAESSHSDTSGLSFSQSRESFITISKSSFTRFVKKWWRFWTLFGKMISVGKIQRKYNTKLYLWCCSEFTPGNPKIIPDHSGNRTYDLSNASPMLCKLSTSHLYSRPCFIRYTTLAFGSSLYTR